MQNVGGDSLSTLQNMQTMDIQYIVQLKEELRFQKPKILKEGMKLSWNFQRLEEGGSNQKPFHGEGIDIFWNNIL